MIHPITAVIPPISATRNPSSPSYLSPLLSSPRVYSLLLFRHKHQQKSHNTPTHNNNTPAPTISYHVSSIDNSMHPIYLNQPHKSMIHT